MNLPISYANGTTVVTTTKDGVTTIECNSGKFIADFPDTIDLKVTDKCDAGCWHCHELSTPKGQHAELQPLLDILERFPSGIQLAVGGGNPLEWPHLEKFLQTVGNRFIINLTVNGVHLNPKTAAKLKAYQDAELLHGIGISAVEGYFSYESINYYPQYQLQNVVMHVIVGNIKKALLESHIKDYKCSKILYPVPNILFLGYKDFGRGVGRMASISQNIAALKKYMPVIFRFANNAGIQLSFDNLALEQLDIKKYIPPDVWQERYLGDEGSRSMYIDAVKQTSGRSSSSNYRKPWTEVHPLDFFMSDFDGCQT